MKTSSKTILTALTLSLALAASPAIAGNCGSGAKATHATATTATPGIYDVAGEAGFTTLSAAVEAAGLEDVLNNEGPFTVFAPTDEAFAKLPAGTLEALLANKEALKQVLLYHVASGELMAADVVDLRAAKTLNGEKIKIEVGENVMINNATVVKTDVRAQNGVIHVIDTVLIPSDLNL